jgi:hypothetical protein
MESRLSKEKMMKPNNQTTFPGTRTTSADVCGWVQSLWCLHARLAPRFARPEPYRRVLAYLQGILSNTSRKNGWQLAEHAGETRPDGMQRLLSNAVWDTHGVRDDLRSYAIEKLGSASAIVAIDAHQLSQAREEIGGCRHAVLRNHRPSGELSGGSLSLVCNSPGASPH